MAHFGQTGGMPIDPVTRRELRRIQRAVELTLGMARNPLETIVDWYTEPVKGRPGRCVHVDADGRVTRVEDLPSNGPREMR